MFEFVSFEPDLVPHTEDMCVCVREEERERERSTQSQMLDATMHLPPHAIGINRQCFTAKYPSGP